MKCFRISLAVVLSLLSAGCPKPSPPAPPVPPPAAPVTPAPGPIDMSEEADPKNPEVIAILEMYARAKVAMDGGKYGDFFEITAPADRLRMLNILVMGTTVVARKLGREAEIKGLFEKFGAPAFVTGEAGDSPAKMDARLKTAWSGVADSRGAFVALFDWNLKAGQPNSHAECFVGTPHVCMLTADTARICLDAPGHIAGTPRHYCNVSKFDGRWYLYGP